MNKIIMLFLIITFCFSSNIYSQNILTKKLISISDSIVVSNIGERLKKYCEISVGSYYNYKTIKGRITTGKFLTKKKLKKNITEAWVLYLFNYSEIKGIRGGFWVKLNDRLQLIEPLQTNFIPSFLWKNEPSNFITIEKARNIGKETFLENGIEILSPELLFDDKYGKYIYRIKNIITRTKTITGQDVGEMEVVEIEAETGNIQRSYKSGYGIIIR
jgi:hypothetical protein